MDRNAGISLGQRIKQRRLALGLKQSDVARKAGIAKSYLSKLEATAGSSPSASILQQIAVVLDTTMSFLLGVPDQPLPPVDNRSLPPALARARVRYRLADDEVALLQGIAYRGKRPQTEEDFLFVLLSIRRAVS
jgi:transcriptional regulator with XRE-family HTH domain